jgi:neutral trehalase
MESSSPRADWTRVNTYIRQLGKRILRHPAGAIRHPYLAITAGSNYEGLLFCWDNYFSALRLAADGGTVHLRNFLDNMFEYRRSDGFIPNAILVDGGPNYFQPGFTCQPFLCQGAAQLLEISGDLDGAARDLPVLEKFIDFWFSAHRAPHGLCRWDGPAYFSGIDNEILATVIHPSSIAAPDLNAYLYAELRSLGYIASKLNDEAKAGKFRDRAETLKEAVNRHLWSDIIGAFGALDTSRDSVRISFGDGDHLEGFGAFAYLSCSALPVLYTGAASQEHAGEMIEKYVLSPDHFRSPFGIRSLSRSSEYCNCAVIGNPGRFDEYSRTTNSNWQGPVWIPLGWMTFHGLLHYGFEAEAAALSHDILKSICHSLDVQGSLSENVDGDTGRPLYAKEYASWNMLGDLMERYIDDTLPPPPKLFF